MSGVTNTLASCAGVRMPRRASAARKAGSANAKLKSDTSVIVRPSWPSLMGISTGRVNVPSLRFTVLLKLCRFWRKNTVAWRGSGALPARS